MKRRQWYHQRFDGAPLYLFAVGDAEVKRESREPAGTGAKVRVCFFEDGKADWYLDMADVLRGAETIIRLAKRDSQISRKLLRAWRRDEEKFQDFFDRFHTIFVRQLNDAALLALYHEYYELFINRFTSSAIIDHFALGTDEHIAKMIRDEIGKVGKESDFTEIFSVATAPVHQSFINKAEMELLKIAIVHNPSHPPLTLRGGENLEQALKRYQRKYSWVKNNYFDAHVLNATHFKKEIELWRKSGADLEVKYKQLRDTPRLNAQKKAALFKKYKFSRLLRTLLKISEDFTWWQDERKKSTFLNIHMGTKI